MAGKEAKKQAILNAPKVKKALEILKTTTEAWGREVKRQRLKTMPTDWPPAKLDWLTPIWVFADRPLQESGE